MKKNKIIITATGLLAIAGLASCGGNNRDIKPQNSIVFANCYSKDATGWDDRFPESCRVFPDWAYTYHIIGSNDKGNVGTYTIEGNTTYELGNDIDFTMTLDQFVILNPIDGEYVDDFTYPKGYRIDNPVYFKIYVSNDDKYYYSYNELGKEYYTIDDSTPGVYKFHIPGEYVRFSYKVFFSASYIDVTSDLNKGYRFDGFSTLPYSAYPEELGKRDNPTAFEKSVFSSRGGLIIDTNESNCYTMTNTRVGKDSLSCVISPSGIAGGLTFTEDYLDKLQFFGSKRNQSTHELKLTDITNYVHTNLVHYYANVPNVEKSKTIDAVDYVYPTNQYRCRVTLPWLNSEHPEGALFTYKDGEYTLNYEQIGVTVKSGCENEKIPTYIKEEEINKKFVIDTTTEGEEQTIKEVKYGFEYCEHTDQFTGDTFFVPTLKIELTAKDGYDFHDQTICDFIRITSKTDYFKNISIDNQEIISRILFDRESYKTEDGSYIEYNFGNVFTFEFNDLYTTATIRINLPDLLSNICFGPSSYSLYLLTRQYLTIDDVHASSIFSAPRTVTLDMVETIKLGFHANVGKK